MKTINFELSKKLNEAGLLDGIETEYVWNPMHILSLYKTKCCGKDWSGLTKTLTKDETQKVFDLFIHYNDRMQAYECGSNRSDWFNEKGPSHFQYGDTEIGAIENMLEYLLANNLLGNRISPGMELKKK